MTWEGLSPPYSTIVADPPWSYDDQPTGIQRGERGGRARTKFLPYSSMTVDQIAELPVAELSQPGGHLYLWTTNRYLERAFQVVRAWGFNPVTTLVWCKEPMGLGPGGRFTVTTEYIIFGRDRRRAGDLIRRAREHELLTQAGLYRALRGEEPTGGGLIWHWENDDCVPSADDWRQLQAILPRLASVPSPAVVPPHTAKVDTTWWQWKRSAAHSTKPPAFLDVVEQVSPGSYVELFARQPRLGWDSWGWGYEQAGA